MDRDLTILGGAGAILLFVGRMVCSWLERRNIADAETQIRAALVVQYGMLFAAFMVKGSTTVKHGFVTKALYLVTSFVHGTFVGLMPLLCLRIFGPSTHFIPQLKSEQQVYL